MTGQHSVFIRGGKLVVAGRFREADHFTAECLGFTTGPEIEINPNRTAWSAAMAFAKQCSAELYRALNKDQAVRELWLDKYRRGEAFLKENLPFYDTLQDYQVRDLIEMAGRKRNLLAYDMGMGKTLTAISMSLMFKAERTLVVCPAGVKWNWFNELKKWGVNELAISVMDTKRSIKALEREGMWAIINFDILGRGGFAKSILDTQWDHIIIDEAHNVKNVRSKRAKAVRAVLHASSKARVTLMTGTPIKNRVNDLFSYLGMCHHPLGRRQQEFEDRYCVKKDGRVIGSRNEPELHARLSNLMVRRLSEGNLELPDMNKHILKIPFDVHMQEYDEMVQQVIQDNLDYVAIGERIRELRDQDYFNNKETIKALQQKRREKKIRLRGHLGAMNKMTAVSKVRETIRLAEELIARGEKVVIFCGYTEPITRLATYFGRRAVVIRGNVSNSERRKREWLFRNTPEVQVFIGNMQAAGVGINLVEARNAIFMSFPMTPDEIRQAEKRVHRQGQEREVYNHYIVCEGSVDEHVMKIIDPKQNQADRILDGKPVYKEYQDVEDKVIGSFLNSLSASRAAS